MALNLDLKTEWINKETARISWNDSHKAILVKSERNPLVYGGMALMCVGIFGGLVTQSLLLTAAGFGLGVFLLMRPYTAVAKPNSIEISPNGLKHRGTIIDTGQISRVEYGKQSQWTGDAIPHGQTDPIEIRVWVDERQFHVISTSTWQSQIVHKIKLEIDDVIAEINKKSELAEREETQGKSSDFGVPDY